MTLVELLAVIVILGIVSAIAVPSTVKIIDNAKYSAIRADGMQILNAAKMYTAENSDITDVDSTVDGIQINQTVLASYLDNVSTFNTYEVTIGSNNQLTLSGIGTKGNISIKFTNATIHDIDTAGKNDTSIPQAQ